MSFFDHCRPWIACLMLGALGLGLVLGSPAYAQDAVPATEATASVDEPAAAVEEAAPAESEGPPPSAAEVSIDFTINSLIMFLCAVLVIFMQAGFAMLEVGLNSAKNTINILFKNVMDFCVGVLLFLFVGYGLMYPGDTENVFIEKVLAYSGPFVTTQDLDAEPITELGKWSNPADFLFQAAFAATAATIVSGAVAGRMKFSAYLIYSAFLTALVYPISGYWKWGGGWLAEAGFADFAGSVVVHALGGFAALAGAIIIGPRIGRFSSDGKSTPLPGHNITFAALGVFILLVGWYGFNPGSQLTYNGQANVYATTYIAVTTTIAAAIGAVVAMVTGWILFGKPDVTMALNGVLAGLVGITANCDQVSQVSALIIGAVAGLLVVLGIVLLEKLKIDDPVGAFPVHGLCGIWGGIATGILGTKIPEGSDRMGYIWVQSYSTAVICAWAFVTMAALFLLLKVVGALRVSAEEETTGLDISEHGMHAYSAEKLGG